ncbi:small ribosomal subunit protein mS27-like [Phymastichus coffea]|uniref:small ribosomal subunit protein mS27-like n=1 Tax=Phymastichus coffea TaxID=108790 RepID=UPI00273B75B3|nr:small ribosomal subunit protein mS27-like [Phymastichus coffea]
MNSIRLLKRLKCNEKLLLQLWSAPKLKRTFLSEAYSCSEAWNKRLESPLLQKINPLDFYLEMDQKIQNQNKIAAVDADIFANCVQDDSQSDELADILHKLRMTRESSFTLESTHHAVIRYYLSIGQTDVLLNILDDRLNYGIFCNYFDYNLLMDYFIKQKDFASAAKVASFMMLQEEFDHPISNALAVYSCHKYLENPDTWQGVDPEVERLKSEPKEEVKIRVRYIRNPYFDDHFDLWKPSDLVGKTLFWVGSFGLDGPLGRTCQLRGAVLYRKYTEAIQILKKWKEECTKEVVYKEVLPLIKKDVPELFESTEPTEEMKELQKLVLDLESADLYQENLEQDMENLIKKAVKAHSEKDMAEQVKLYEEWLEKRVQVLKIHLAELDKISRLAKIEDMKKDLADRERVLTFFEKEEQIELAIEEKLAKEKELYGDESEEVTDDEENYIPPEIVTKQGEKR